MGSFITRRKRSGRSFHPRPPGSSALLLPEGDLAAGGRRDDAAPAGRALTRGEQSARAELARAARGGADVGHLDVGQPERTGRRALNDATPKPRPHLERLVGAVTRV